MVGFSRKFCTRIACISSAKKKVSKIFTVRVAGHWNSERPAGATNINLNDVSCAVPVRGPLRRIAETWSSLKVPAPGKGKSSDFEGVSCLKAYECVTIGGAVERVVVEAGRREVNVL
jgi:hypothetical protein